MYKNKRQDKWISCQIVKKMWTTSHDFTWSDQRPRVYCFLALNTQDSKSRKTNDKKWELTKCIFDQQSTLSTSTSFCAPTAKSDQSTGGIHPPTCPCHWLPKKCMRSDVAMQFFSKEQVKRLSFCHFYPIFKIIRVWLQCTNIFYQNKYTLPFLLLPTQSCICGNITSWKNINKIFPCDYDYCCMNTKTQA